MSPVIKLAALVLVCGSVFFAPLPGVALLALAVAAGAALGGRSLLATRAARRLLTFGLLLFCAQLIFTRQGVELARLPLIGLRVTELGVVNGLLMAGRFVVCVLASLVFVATTDPGDLAYDLMRRGLPYRYGFALVTMLRFLPLAGEASDTVRQAQAARGVDLTSGGPRAFLVALRYWLLPLLVSSLERVDTLAVSMEARAFGLYRRRTFSQRPPRSPADRVVLGVAVAVCAAAIWL